MITVLIAAGAGLGGILIGADLGPPRLLRRPRARARLAPAGAAPMIWAHRWGPWSYSRTGRNRYCRRCDHKQIALGVAAPIVLRPHRDGLFGSVERVWGIGRWICRGKR